MPSKPARPVRVAVEWDGTVVAERLLGGGAITIGEEAGADLTVPGVSGRLEVVRVDRGLVTLYVPPEWAGTLWLGGEDTPAAHAGREVRLGESDSARLRPPVDVAAESESGGTVVIVERAERARFPLGRRRDWALAEALLLALVFHAGFLGVAFRFGGALAEDLRPPKLEERQAYFILKKPPPEEEPEPPPTEAPKAKVAEDLPSEPRDRRQAIVARVQKRGVLRALSAGSALKGLFSSSASSRLEEAISGLQGNELAGPGDGPGFGTTRTGMGGGGTSGFGVTSYTGANIGGVGQAAAVEARLGRRRERKANVDISGGGGSVEGSLTRADIEKVIRAHTAGIKYCYEQQLVAYPQLEGKVTAKWWIDPDGVVFNAIVEESTVSNVDLEGCLLRQIRRWRFPRPGTGNVIVRFPFIFRGAV